MTSREIADFCRWCAVSAARMTLEARLLHHKVRSLPLGDPVESATSNRRIRTAMSYLIWLTTELHPQEADGRRSGLDSFPQIVAELRQAFQKHEYAEARRFPIRSLDDRSNNAVLRTIDTAPAQSAHDRRDALIVRVLYDAGLRAGELLKLQCDDIKDVLELAPSKPVGCIEVQIRPNDPFDDRRVEPAAKTLPRQLPVARTLTRDLHAYITGDRQTAVDACGWEHPYLFVCHSGPRVGRPISQRNLNRLIRAFGQRTGLEGALHPHILRHTHFDRLHDRIEAHGKDPRSVLEQRGGWTNRSGMPERYSQRSVTKQAAKYVSQREDAARGKQEKK